MAHLYIAICDDERTHLDETHSCLIEYFKDKNITYTIDAFEDTDLIINSAQNYDLAFSDIEAGNKNGLYAARKLVERRQSVLIFFITHYQFHLDEAMNVNSFRYFTKPFSKSRFFSGLDIALKKWKLSKEKIIVTENKILNILLSQKLKICNENGISMHCYFENISFDFIKDLDLISIFANLIDNAIESCIVSEKKFIYLNAYILNEAYSVIKVENNADLKPLTVGGKLVTQKNDKHNSGFGVKSILKAVKRYKGNPDWDYDEEKKLFKAIVMFNSAKNIKKHRVKGASLFRHPPKI